ncbi:MAG: dTDP-4-dehydrorhamnose 3,5-epimerase [Aquisalinus sp.]|nr:dTDP-4-dehydrorhamnose 3,5-epimerase [Aquisalinus sp.]
MEVRKLDIPDVLLFSPKRFEDDRGFFSETFRQTWIDDQHIPIRFVQDNHARSTQAGVVRGLHFQYGKATQSKLIRVIKGAIFDVVVDIRHGSPTFGKHVSAILSEENWQQLFVPHGFAHGYCTLNEETEVIYKVDRYYEPTHEAALLWNDPALGIGWPCDEETAILSLKDAQAPRLQDMATYFQYAPNAKPFPVIDNAQTEKMS